MARVIVYGIGARGDVLPFVPVAAELAARGHDVGWNFFDARLSTELTVGLFSAHYQCHDDWPDTYHPVGFTPWLGPPDDSLPDDVRDFLAAIAPLLPRCRPVVHAGGLGIRSTPRHLDTVLDRLLAEPRYSHDVAAFGLRLAQENGPSRAADLCESLLLQVASGMRLMVEPLPSSAREQAGGVACELAGG